MPQPEPHSPFDDQGNPRISQEDISRELLLEYLEYTDSRLLQRPHSKLQLLERLSLLSHAPDGARLIKNAAAMMFCPHPEKFFPGTRAEVVLFPEGRSRNPRKYEVLPPFTGSVPSIIAAVIEYFTTCVVRETRLAPRGSSSLQCYCNYPIRALREALVHAFCYKNYRIGEPIEIFIEPQQITICSHCGPQLSLSAFTESTFAQARRERNSRLITFMARLGLTEREASAFPIIRQALKLNGSPGAFIETGPDRSYLKVIIPCRPDPPPPPNAPYPGRAAGLLRRFFHSQIHRGFYSGGVPDHNQALLMIRILRAAFRPVPMSTLISLTDGMSASSAKRHIIHPLIGVYLLGMTIPYSPRSCRQRYQTSLSATVFFSD